MSVPKFRWLHFPSRFIFQWFFDWVFLMENCTIMWRKFNKSASNPQGILSKLTMVNRHAKYQSQKYQRIIGDWQWMWLLNLIEINNANCIQFGDCANCSKNNTEINTFYPYVFPPQLEFNFVLQQYRYSIDCWIHDKKKYESNQCTNSK